MRNFTACGKLNLEYSRTFVTHGLFFLQEVTFFKEKSHISINPYGLDLNSIFKRKFQISLQYEKYLK